MVTSYALLLVFTTLLGVQSSARGELIVDGGFENSTASVGPVNIGIWQLGGPTTAVIRDPVHCYHGQQCGALTAVNSGSYTITQQFTGMVPNSTYVLQYRYKNLSEVPVKTCSMAARLDGATTNEHMVLADCKAGFDANEQGEYEYALVTKPFLAVEAEGMLQFFLLCIGDSFSVVFDDVRVVPDKLQT